MKKTLLTIMATFMVTAIGCAAVMTVSSRNHAKQIDELTSGYEKEIEHLNELNDGVAEKYMELNETNEKLVKECEELKSDMQELENQVYRMINGKEYSITLDTEDSQHTYEGYMMYGDLKEIHAIK